VAASAAHVVMAAAADPVDLADHLIVVHHLQVVLATDHLGVQEINFNRLKNDY
jgi:hypothetical protein